MFFFILNQHINWNIRRSVTISPHFPELFPALPASFTNNEHNVRAHFPVAFSLKNNALFTLCMVRELLQSHSKPACLGWSPVLIVQICFRMIPCHSWVLLKLFYNILWLFIYCLCAGCCVQRFFKNCLWCRVKLENVMFVLTGLSAVKIQESIFFINWNWICFFTVHVCDLHIHFHYLL